jgi:hypothetical protein
MLKTKPISVGIDAHISRLQEFMYNELTSGPWVSINGIENKFKCYGRCYRNNTANGYLPELYNSKGEYLPLTYDDNLTVISFFGVGEDISIQQNAKAPVHLIFWVNLNKLKPSVALEDDRVDEAVRLQVYDILKPRHFGFELTGITTGWDNVFAEYSAMKTVTDKYRDMHPYHAFRFDFSLMYNPSHPFNS